MNKKKYVVEDYLITIFSFIILMLSILFTKLISYPVLSLICHVIIYVSAYLVMYGLYNVNRHNYN